MVEIYTPCKALDIEEGFLADLQRGWDEIFLYLKEIGVGEIADVEAMEITLLDDDEMSRLHEEFLQDPKTTDVITFEHGELLIGVEVAKRQALEYGNTFERELALYGIHGMLHLAGYDDRSKDEFEVMKMRQEEILELFFPLE